MGYVKGTDASKHPVTDEDLEEWHAELSNLGKMSKNSVNFRMLRMIAELRNLKEEYGEFVYIVWNEIMIEGVYSNEKDARMNILVDFGDDLDEVILTRHKIDSEDASVALDLSKEVV